jgi:alpha-L-rhamnosidase
LLSLCIGREALLAADRGNLWESGKVNPAQSTHVIYAGKPLESRMRCWWKVRVWERNEIFAATGQRGGRVLPILMGDDWESCGNAPAGRCHI